MALDRLESGLTLYRFCYTASPGTWVGVMAQEVLAVDPKAVSVDEAGYYLVDYGRLGLDCEPYEAWRARHAGSAIG